MIPSSDIDENPKNDENQDGTEYEYDTYKRNKGHLSDKNSVYGDNYYEDVDATVVRCKGIEISRK